MTSGRGWWREKGWSRGCGWGRKGWEGNLKPSPAAMEEKGREVRERGEARDVAREVMRGRDDIGGTRYDLDTSEGDVVVVVVVCSMSEIGDTSVLMRGRGELWGGEADGWGDIDEGWGDRLAGWGDTEAGWGDVVVEVGDTTPPSLGVVVGRGLSDTGGGE